MNRVFYVLIPLFMYGAGCQPGAPEKQKISAPPDGMAIFRKNCVVCHGADGKLGQNGAKDLSASVLSQPERVQIITQGKNIMTPFKGVLTPEEIEAVATYTLSLNPQNAK